VKRDDCERTQVGGKAKGMGAGHATAGARPKHGQAFPPPPLLRPLRPVAPCNRTARRRLRGRGGSRSAQPTTAIGRNRLMPIFSDHVITTASSPALLRISFSGVTMALISHCLRRGRCGGGRVAASATTSAHTNGIAQRTRQRWSPRGPHAACHRQGCSRPAMDAPQRGPALGRQRAGLDRHRGRHLRGAAAQRSAEGCTGTGHSLLLAALLGQCAEAGSRVECQARRAASPAAGAPAGGGSAWGTPIAAGSRRPGSIWPPGRC
jgi:hypothetical protein